MKATIKGDKLTIELDLKEQESKSGKTLVVSTTSGFKNSGEKYKGKDVFISVNAYVNKDK